MSIKTASEDPIEAPCEVPTFVRTISGENGRPTGKHTLALCTSTFLHRDWTSSWGYRITVPPVKHGQPGSPRCELVLLHETIGYLAANLYEMSLRMNELGGSNQIVYTAYCLGLWIYRWWHLIQHKGDTVLAEALLMDGGDKKWHRDGCSCQYCFHIEQAAQSFLQLKIIPFFTRGEYEHIEGEVKLTFSESRPLDDPISARQLFEPGYDAYQNEQSLLTTSGPEGEKQFDKHLQICCVCIRKEIHCLYHAIDTMYLIRHRPVFQSLRAVLRKTYATYPLGVGRDADTPMYTSLLPSSVTELVASGHAKWSVKKTRQITVHYANCLERVAIINETSLERAKLSQEEVQKLFQTEGVITGLVLGTAAGSIGLLGNVDASISTQHPRLVASCFGLFLSSTLLSLWAAMLYVSSSVRLLHPFSRPYMKHGKFTKWALVYVLHWDSLTRVVLAIAFVSLTGGLLSFARIFIVSRLDNTAGAATAEAPQYHFHTVQAVKVAPLVIASLAFAHLAGRSIWHYVWEYAYAWRVWRRYKSAVEGSDTVEENRFRNGNVFMEILAVFASESLCPIVRPFTRILAKTSSGRYRQPVGHGDV